MISLCRATWQCLCLIISLSPTFQVSTVSFFSHNHREQVLRSTGHSSTIQIKENDFDEYKSCNLRLGFSSTWEQQLSKKELVEEKKKKIDFD